MRQLVLESAPTISTVRQQPREYGLSCHVRTQSQTSLVRCQLGSFLHLLYSLTLSHIPLPFRLQPSFSENPSPFTLLPNLSPPCSDRLPLFSDTISLTRITFLSLDSHHSSLIFVVLLISSTHPPLFAACILFSLFSYLPLPISWRSTRRTPPRLRLPPPLREISPRAHALLLPPDEHRMAIATKLHWSPSL